MTASILLIEDEIPIADSLLFVLQREGYVTAHVTLGREALLLLKNRTIDLVIMDVGLPDINGFLLCQQVRAFSNVPILFLTAHADTLEREMGFELGADDYVTKPFSLKEVLLRVKALLRRSLPQAYDHSALLTHDIARKQIRFNEQAIPLTRAEYLVLVTLLSQPEFVFSREQLLQQLPNSEDSSDRIIDTLIKQLRSKLREAGAGDALIVTHRGFGYSIRRPS